MTEINGMDAAIRDAAGKLAARVRGRMVLVQQVGGEFGGEYFANRLGAAQFVNDNALADWATRSGVGRHYRAPHHTVSKSALLAELAHAVGPGGCLVIASPECMDRRALESMCLAWGNMFPAWRPTLIVLITTDPRASWLGLQRLVMALSALPAIDAHVVLAPGSVSWAGPESVIDILDSLPMDEEVG